MVSEATTTSLFKPFIYLIILSNIKGFLLKYCPSWNLPVTTSPPAITPAFLFYSNFEPFFGVAYHLAAVGLTCP